MKVTLRLSNGRAMVSADTPPAPLRFLSVCSGIEAASLAWSGLGWRAIGFAEIEKFPSAVLAHHYPNVLNHGDFTKIDTSRLGRVDILCGGTPCQAFSVAGARRSLDDARGNLTLAFVDFAHDLARNNRLRNVVWENVPGVLSTKDNAFGCFLAGLVGADEPLVPVEPCPAAGKSNKRYGWSAKDKRHYVKWPRNGVVVGPKGRAAWTVKDAQYFGLAQRRERVIVVADFGIGADPAAVLFEPEGVRRDSPPSRETGQGIAPTISARTQGGGGLGTDFDLDGGLIHAPTAYDGNRTSGPLEVATAVNAHGGPHGRLDFESETFVCFDTTQITSAANRSNPQPGDPCHPLAAGAHPPAICFSAKDYGADATVELAPTLRAGGHTSSHANAGVMPAVAMTVALRGREGGGTAELGDDVSFALRASSGGGDKPHVLTHAIQAGALRENPESGPDGVGVQAGIAYTLEARAEVQAVQFASAVRRLTPRECERLQGFQFLVSPTYPGAWRDEAGRWWSPDYTAIPWRGKPTDQCPDGPRYKALGNSWAVPKFRWLGERIQKFMPL